MFRGKNRDHFAKPTVSLQELPKQLPRLSWRPLVNNPCQLSHCNAGQPCGSCLQHVPSAGCLLFALLAPCCKAGGKGHKPCCLLADGSCSANHLEWQFGLKQLSILAWGGWCCFPGFAENVLWKPTSVAQWALAHCQNPVTLCIPVLFRPITGCMSNVHGSRAYAKPLTVGRGSCSSVLLHLFPQFRKPLLRVA